MNRTRTAMMAALAALTALGGCREDGRMFWARPTPEEKVEKLYAEGPADTIREGICEVSSEPWGLQEPHLARYAEILRQNPEPACRSAAARALGRAGDPSYVPVLARALEDPDASVRWDVAVALGDVTGPEAVEPLCTRAVRDSSSDVRTACAKSLRHYEGEPVRQALIRCLLDEDFSVRYQARQSLVALTGADRGYDPVAWRELPDEPASSRAEDDDRPWWDWAGVTDDDDDTDGEGGEPTPSDGTDALEQERERAAADEPEQESGGRPWWDWFGVTEDEAEEPQPAEPTEMPRPEPVPEAVESP